MLHHTDKRACLFSVAHTQSRQGIGTGIGVGPVWQIVEELGWFKEAEKLKPGAAPEQQVNEEAAVVEPTSEQEQELVYDERRRRPRVYADVAPRRFGRFHFVSKMRPHICQLTEVLLIPMAVLPLHRRYLATLVRLGNRPRSTSDTRNTKTIPVLAGKRRHCLASARRFGDLIGVLPSRRDP
ncbi:hypothetical protein BGY98DRAFT_979518 [Russula aff. rugulosa BPL654]|nr:hypothetical protein BGY98DRAFT_979518 [Russula aff. rugulosa BPL654]